ncbi:sodium:proton antiporter [Desulfosarcina alkanivorans]|jgi:multicomponent Na+:H+ antiporter subunit E|uniref:Sodium:proton antiporter n=1 Tax=Desulfosarcina alkanivorans TaxID=571177 RepID=A0A5K7YLC3_9BACT|nr:Na+/H+ antiporter subunit E [Desulfosarcina alkanivorans]BBO69215.1 sodium:proton antiporter [Desulfosarcina alkanivorans]
MNLFFINTFIALGYIGVQGQFSLFGFMIGFALGYLALWLTQPLYGRSRYFQRAPKTVRLVGFFLVELLLCNLRVFWDVITPGHISRPGIVGVPLSAESDMEILLVANLISLTPGTLSVDLSDDRRTLYVHVMYLDDPDRFRHSIKTGLEQRVLEVTRDH